MKVNDFISKLKHIANLPTTYYSVSGGDWAKWNGSSWNFDCVILVKAILWGWCENKNHAHGGANYLSNGVADDTADGLINRCSNISTDFTNITVGELLYMGGHVGVYIGNGEVIECTGAWERKVLYSKIDSNGRRSRNGKQVGSWLKHGKLPYIDYNCEVVNKKTTIEIANEVIAGKWGNGEERKRRLTEAGYDYRTIQDEVNRIVNAPTSYKTVDELAHEVIAGKWGNGEERKRRLTEAGYDYGAVQSRVDEILKPKTYTKGSKVLLKANATRYCTGQTIPSFIKGKTYTIQQVGCKNYPNGLLLKEIYSWVDKSEVE